MTVPILIVGFRNASDVSACLSALSRLTEQDFSVNVCENGGRPAFETLRTTLSSETPADDPGHVWSSTLAGGQPVIVVEAQSNLGYAGGINLLLDQLDGEKWEHAWILNPDTEPHPDALTALLNKAATGPYGIVGSRIVFAGTDTVQMYGVRWCRWLGRGLSLGLGNSVGEAVDEGAIEGQIDFVSGSSMLVSREFLEEVGRMRDDYFLYFEDVDWCLRRGRLALGYAHDSIVHHKHGSTIGSSTDPRERSGLSVYLTERNRILLMRRFFPLTLLTGVPAALAFVIRYLAQGAPRAFRVGLLGWFHGLLGRTGPPPARYLP